jgi:signal transduction histidine kinase
VKNLLKRSNFILIALFLVVFNINLAQSHQSSTQVAADTLVVDSLNAHASSFRYTNLDSLDLYAHQAYDLANELSYIPGLVEATRLKLVTLLVNGSYTEAIGLLYNKKLKIEDSSYIREKAIIDYFLGVIYNASGDFSAGLPYLLNALEIFQNINDKSYELQCLNNLGVCYIRLEKFEEALDIFLKLESIENDQNPGFITTLAVNLAYSYYGIGNYPKAHEVLKNFFDLPADQVNERGYGFAYFILGEVYVKQGKIAEAIDAFNSSISTFEKFKSHNDKVEPLIGLALVYHEMNDNKNARIQSDQALTIAKKSGILALQKQALHTSYTILKAQKKYDEAVEVQEQYQAVVDSIVTTLQSKEMGRLTAQYDFNQERNELLLEQKEAELKSQNLQNRQRLVINVSVIIILSVVGLLVLIYRSYQLKIRSNEALRTKNKEIEIHRDKLEEINKVKNKLLSIIGHDLRSPINSLNGLLYLVKNKMANNEELETVLPSLIDNFDQTNDLLNNLLSWTTSQMEGYTLNFKNFNIKDVLVDVLAHAKYRIEEKSIDYNIEGESSMVYGEQDMIKIVCQNLIGNAIKFCNPGDTIQINIIVSDKIWVHIKDTGVGISEEKIKRLLKESKFSSTDGTQKEKGSGLGLTISKDFLMTNNSKLQIESSKNEGSTFFFSLPKASQETIEKKPLVV